MPKALELFVEDFKNELLEELVQLNVQAMTEVKLQVAKGTNWASIKDVQEKTGWDAVQNQRFLFLSLVFLGILLRKKDTTKESQIDPKTDPIFKKAMKKDTTFVASPK